METDKRFVTGGHSVCREARTMALSFPSSATIKRHKKKLLKWSVPLTQYANMFKQLSCMALQMTGSVVCHMAL